jgi:predicted nucleotidyltransferase
LARLGAESVSVFGSCARGQQHEGSDVDVIVDLRPGHGYFDLAEMANILRVELDVDVNLVAASGVPSGSAILRERIRVI